ncbi:mlr4686 [Mesorhizobium japonicum MAFF 303099]|uniref:Mlr4686 protein n=1 Tax=Mesorhizobium japonicum (strain LMG 29417 / CECT 9101 / MAFF 303099) TaxID=266835 RepID=Q98DI7_RHILO|nr:mlr4686 [Mesorhizobium japonicum MAFF 303099]
MSDSPDQVEKTAKGQGFKVEWGAPLLSFDSEAKEATLLDGDNACGWIRFNGDRKINSMLFAACFFGADGLGLRQVTQEFVNKFGGQAEMEIIPAGDMCKGAQPFAFKGRTSEGELFRLWEDCGAWTPLGVRVEIKPGSGKGLKF